MYPAFDLVKCFREVPYGKALTETSMSFVLLPVALTSGVLVIAGLICGCIGKQLVC
jgi:CBS-domain-containing membrane protein